MYKVKIKKEFYAQRCEICHKADYFDPQKNSCTRCNQLTIEKTPKGNFKVNWRVDLSALQNSLRNFAWQNLESNIMKVVRRIVITLILSLIIVQLLDYQIINNVDHYYIPPLPGSQTEDFTMWSCCGCTPSWFSSVEGIIITVFIFGVFGAFIGLITYYSNEPKKGKLTY